MKTLELDAVDIPPAVVATMMSVFPAACAGLVAVIDVAETTVTLDAEVPPKVTMELLLKFVPVIVTDVPPAVEPLDGLIPVTVGVGTA